MELKMNRRLGVQKMTHLKGNFDNETNDRAQHMQVAAILCNRIKL
jgi:hypothetical protein